MADAGKSKYPHGTEVAVMVRGIVQNRSGKNGSDFHQGAQRVMDEGGYAHWIYPWSEASPVTVLTPAHGDVAPGQVWLTEDGAYFARESNPDISLRMTPADLTDAGGLKTTDVHDFFRRYPQAEMVFDLDQATEARTKQRRPVIGGLK